MTTAPSRLPRVGLLTLGQGPRPEFERLHARLFAALGIEATLVSRHVLDGLADDAITALTATDDEPAINSNLRGEGAPSPLGPGWSARWISRAGLVPLIQHSLDVLEQEEAVDLTICCVAEAFPAHSFRSRRPFVLPATVMASYAEMLAATRPDATLGFITHGTRQRAQQQAIWDGYPWARQMQRVYATDGSLEVALADLAAKGTDLILIWAYAAGLGPKDPPDRLRQLAAAQETPLLVPAVVATLFARNLLQPPFMGSADHG